MEDARARRRASELPGDDYDGAGAHLAAVRETAGYSLDEAAAKTHIKERHLRAIEETDLENLPPRPYAIGFVKSYAEFLGLDAAAVVDRFKEDMGFAAPAAVEVEKFEAAETAAEDSQRELSFVAVAAILIFFIWCAYQITLTGDRTHRPATANAPLADNAGGPAVMEPEAVTPAPVEAEVIEARILERVEPVFPIRCLNDALPVESVQVMFHITASGLVSSERVADSTNACFNEAALNAVKRWRFEPRTVDGAPRPAYDQRTVLSFQRPQ